MRDAQTSTALGLENVTTSAAQAWALAAAAQSAGTAHTRLLKPAQLPIIVTARNYRCRTRPDESRSSLSPGVQPPLCCQPLQMLGKGPSSFLRERVHAHLLLGEMPICKPAPRLKTGINHRPAGNGISSASVAAVAFVGEKLTWASPAISTFVVAAPMDASDCNRGLPTWCHSCKKTDAASGEVMITCSHVVVRSDGPNLARSCVQLAS
jgi:hypothetical protein